MKTTARIRRDANGTTEEQDADVTRDDKHLHLHLHASVEIREHDVIMLDADVVKSILEGEG
jgi:hypothetical protein